MSAKEDSLQSLPVPTVEITEGIDFTQFKTVYLTTKVMKPLFPLKFLDAQEIGSVKMTLRISGSRQEALEHSWNFNENFPNEFDPALHTDEATSERSYTFDFPIHHIPNNNSALLVVDENFLKLSPIFDNVLAKKLISLASPDVRLFILGTSDKISATKRLGSSDSSLTPPEFIGGFIGGLFANLVMGSALPFSSIVVVSEGPTGFEKISQESMDELLTSMSQEWGSSIDTTAYKEECRRCWRYDGAAMSTQSGLYI